MSNQAYGAKLTLEYVVQLQVRQANPSEEIQRVYRIQPRKYLIIPKTGKIFPNEIIPNCFSDRNQPFGSMTGRGLYKVDYHTPNLDQLEVGNLAEVLLQYQFIDVLKQTKEKFDGLQRIRYEPGEFEKILRNAKRDFLSQIRKMGLPAEPSKISIVLIGDYETV